MGSDYLLILEFADNGTLENYLKNNFNKLSWDMKLQFAIQIADAVSCIHKNNIIHRDLVSNIFINLLGRFKLIISFNSLNNDNILKISKFS
jgi:serine/threonine protein kinase